MDYSINCLSMENFKSYATLQEINMSDLSVLLGANSSGKSTAIQTLLTIKQTMECNSRDIELLLSGKYVALGDFDDVVYDKTKEEFSLGVGFKCTKINETTDIKDSYRIVFHFGKADNKYQAILKGIDVLYEDKCVSFFRESQNKYQMAINRKLTPIMVYIRNLCMTGEMSVKYDVDFNKVFVNFINEIREIIDGKKTRKLAFDKMVSSRLITEFFMSLFSEEYKNQDEVKDGLIETLVESLVDLIDKYSSYQNLLGSDYLSLTKDMKKSCLISVITNPEKVIRFQEVYDKYLSEFNKYSQKKSDITKYRGEERFSRYMFMLSDNTDNNDIVDAFQWVNEFYGEFEETISNLLFVGPIRETPKGLYNIGFEQNPKYVGPTGANFASVLLHENKIKKYFLPYDDEDEISLWEALNEWAAHLNIASAVQVYHVTSFGIKVSISDTQNKTADIMNVGIGTSQVLPVLITGLLSEKDEILVFEQPELHLHPFSQSRLADFFVALIKRGRKIIIETHSEALILRLRYHLINESIDADAIAINFFQNNQGTKVSQCSVSGFGDIDYPKDFKDETQELLNDLMNAALKKELK